VQRKVKSEESKEDRLRKRCGAVSLRPIESCNAQSSSAQGQDRAVEQEEQAGPLHAYDTAEARPALAATHALARAPPHVHWPRGLDRTEAHLLGSSLACHSRPLLPVLGQPCSGMQHHVAELHHQRGAVHHPVAPGDLRAKWRACSPLSMRGRAGRPALLPPRAPCALQWPQRILCRAACSCHHLALPCTPALLPARSIKRQLKAHTRCAPDGNQQQGPGGPAARACSRSLPTQPSRTAKGSCRCSSAAGRSRTFSSTPWPAQGGKGGHRLVLGKSHRHAGQCWAGAQGTGGVAATAAPCSQVSAAPRDMIAPWTCGSQRVHAWGLPGPVPQPT